MKRLYITIIFSLGLIGTLFTACFCKDVQPFWNPVSGSVTVYSMLDNNFMQVYSGDTIQTDSLALSLSYDAEFVAMEYSPLVQLGNMARATQKCPVDGHVGLKYKATSISITSNESYNGVNPGEELSQFFNYRGQPLESNYLNTLNGYSYEHVAYGYEREIYWITQPSNPVERNLTIKVDFENGHSVLMQTLDFTW